MSGQDPEHGSRERHECHVEVMEPLEDGARQEHEDAIAFWGKVSGTTSQELAGPDR